MATAVSGAALAHVSVAGVAGLPDLELEIGPITALVGPRGSGKSQLLASIAWLVSGRPSIVPAGERTVATVSADLRIGGESASVVRKPGRPLSFGPSRPANLALPACTFLRARDRFGRPRGRAEAAAGIASHDDKILHAWRRFARASAGSVPAALAEIVHAAVDLA
jgi:ABC-type iron transport system FetAB ATPase subunit